MEYIKSIAVDFKSKIGIIDDKVRGLRAKVKEALPQTKTQSGIFGIDALKENIESDRPGILTSVMQEFLDGYGEEPIVYVAGRPSSNDIQELRRVYCYFASSETGCSINADGEESDYLSTLAEMFRSGINIQMTYNDSTGSFVDYYIGLHGRFLETFQGDKVPLVSRCIELTSYAEDTVITVNRNHYCSNLKLTKGQFDELRKPFVSKRKAAMKVSMQADNLDDEEFDVNEPPDYVMENEDYRKMWKECGYYPRLNKKSEPVCYMFRNKTAME